MIPSQTHHIAIKPIYLGGPITRAGPESPNKYTEKHTGSVLQDGMISSPNKVHYVMRILWMIWKIAVKREKKCASISDHSEDCTNKMYVSFYTGTFNSRKSSTSRMTKKRFFSAVIILVLWLH